MQEGGGLEVEMTAPYVEFPLLLTNYKALYLSPLAECCCFTCLSNVWHNSITSVPFE